MSARVSVVIPAHDVESYLDETLASVAAQTRPPDEVVVVDDCSHDRTGEIAESWSGRLPLRVIRTPTNLGCGGARGLGIRSATHDVIANLDADDVWRPDHLATVLPLLVDEHTIVTPQAIRWAGEPDPTPEVLEPTSIPAPDDQPREILRGNFLFTASIYHRSTMMAAGGPSEDHRCEDWDNWARMIRNGARVRLAGHPTCLYRSRADSLSADEGCLSGDITLYEEWLDDVDLAPHRRLLRAELRRRRARLLYVEAIRETEAGRPGPARRLHLRAAAVDRSLRGGLGPGSQGSVTVRAALGVAAPRWTAEQRRRRLVRKRLATPDGASRRSTPATVRP